MTDTIDLNIKIAKIVGANKDLFWSQTHVFFPKDELKKKEAGNLLVSFSFKAKNDNLDITSFGKEIISRLQEIYYSSQEPSILLRLKNSLVSLNQEFLEQVELEISAAVTMADKEDKVLVYFACLEKTQAYLWRDNNLVNILKGNPYEVVSASGLATNADVFILGTAQFFELISLGILKASLENKEVVESAETMAPIIHGHADNSKTASVIFKIEIDKLGTVEPQPKPIQPVLTKTISFPKIPKFNISGIKEKIQSAVQVFQEKKQLFTSPNIKIKDDNERSKQKKTTLSVAIILIILLIISVILGANKKSATSQNKQMQQLIQAVNQRYDEAVALENLNIVRARTLLIEAQDIIAKEKDSLKNRTDKSKAEELEQKISLELGKITKEYKIDKAEVYMDLNLTKEGFKADKWAATEKYLYLFDSSKYSVLQIDKNTKSTKVVAGGEKLTGGKLIAADENRVFIATQDKVMVIDVAKTEIINEIKADKWGEIGDVVSFSGSLYLLDKQNNQIWKYQDPAAAKPAKGTYLKKETNFKDAVSLAINGFVWVLYGNGEVAKFSRGVKDNFNMTGLDKPLIEPIKLYTEATLDNLYILDRKGMKVVAINKETGELQGQYLWPGISGTTDIYADESKNQILLLVNDRIYQLDLRK